MPGRKYPLFIVEETEVQRYQVTHLFPWAISVKVTISLASESIPFHDSTLPPETHFLLRESLTAVREGL